MDTLSPHVPNDNPHYVYTLAYPESMGGAVFYVGKGKGNRINNHELEASKGVKSYKCNVIRKIWAQGEQVVKTKLAFFETHREACLYEIALIFFMDGLTNLTYGGDGAVGVVVSEEVRIKRNRSISEANKKSHRVQQQLAGLREKQKGVPRSPTVKIKISDALKGKPGRPHTDTSRRKIGEANKGRVIPESTRRAVGEANKMRAISEDARRKMSESRMGHAPHPHAIAAMRESRLGTHLSPEHKRILRETKSHLTDEQAAIAKFNAYGLMQREYAELFGVSPSAINFIVRGKTYQHITVEHLPLSLHKPQSLWDHTITEKETPIRDKQGRFIQGADNGWRERKRNSTGQFLPRERKGGDA